MFERYTEKARRTIFFARYEASQRSSGYIEPEDLLLGALREDPVLKSALPPESVRPLIEQLHAIEPAMYHPTATSVDLPLSAASKRALAFGAEEAELQSQETIGPGHLVLGVLRAGGSPASTALESLGLGLDRFREIVKKGNTRPRTPRRNLSFNEPMVISPSLSNSVTSLRLFILTVIESFYEWEHAQLSGVVQEAESWNRKEAFGHLIDLAMAHQQWIAAGLAQGELHAGNVPDRAWVEAQKYTDIDWNEMINLWVLVNRHLLSVIAGISEDKLSILCRIGDADPVPLERMISEYVDDLGEWIRKIDLRPE